MSMENMFDSFTNKDIVEGDEPSLSGSSGAGSGAFLQNPFAPGEGGNKPQFSQFPRFPTPGLDGGMKPAGSSIPDNGSMPIPGGGISSPQFPQSPMPLTPGMPGMLGSDRGINPQNPPFPLPNMPGSGDGFKIEMGSSDLGAPGFGGGDILSQIAMSAQSGANIAEDKSANAISDFMTNVETAKTDTSVDFSQEME